MTNDSPRLDARIDALERECLNDRERIANIEGGLTVLRWVIGLGLAGIATIAAVWERVG